MTTDANDEGEAVIKALKKETSEGAINTQAELVEEKL